MSISDFAAGLLSLGVAILMQTIAVRAETYDIVTYAPPPGWSVQNLQDGRLYERSDKSGTIVLHAGRFEFPDLAFVVTWRELIETKFPGPPPAPQVFQEGAFTIASGIKQNFSNNPPTAIQLVTIAGQGRRLAIVAMGAGNQPLKELDSFVRSVAITGAAPPPAPTISDLVGRWWKDAGTSTYWYEFTADGRFSHETPVDGVRTGTFQIEGDSITFTGASGETTSRPFHFECTGGTVSLELDSEHGYWSTDRRC